MGNMASSHVTVGSGDHCVLALHGWFGSARGWGPSAELEVVPNAGHYPMYETPAALAASIEEFLGRD